MTSTLGSVWSLWQPGTAQRGLNIVTGDRLTASLIISVLLIRQGEDAIHPTLGIAPELFEPISGYNPRLWSASAREEILRWVGTIEDLSIQINKSQDAENRLSAYIVFRSKNKPDRNVLTFGWLEYTGALYNREMSAFLDDLQLNDQRFTGF